MTVKGAQRDQVWSVSTELEAMTRRILAFDAVGVSDFNVFQRGPITCSRRYYCYYYYYYYYYY